MGIFELKQLSKKVYFNYDKFILDNNQLIKLKEIIIKANKYKDNFRDSQST